ncbi:MAG: sialidase family protein [Aeromicrobium sp.]
MSSVGAREPLPDAGMAMKRSATPDVAGYDKQHGPHAQFECIAASGGANTKLDCDDPFPNNEPNIVVDPAAPGHMIASSNDYGSCCDQFYTTLDNAATWSTGNMSRNNPQQTGSDPVTVFDRKHGTAIHSSLNYSFQLPTGESCRGDVTVSVSPDGGITWLPAEVVDSGFGCDLSNTQLFNDKEWIVTDNYPTSPNYGRTYLTWTKFISASGVFQSSPIFESHSDDGGLHWTKPHEISGANAALCTFQSSGPVGRCDENQFSVPTVAPDGTVYVAFQNSQNQALWETGEFFDDQYLLVKSTDGGATWSSPTLVVGLEDGSADYPLNVDGRQTLTGYQVRVGSAGNIVASPTDGTLYLVFSDNRNGVHDAASPTTNTDIFLMVSSNGGTSWSGPTLVDSAAGDQWFPWVDVNPTSGNIGILYNDRGSSNGALYNASIAEGTPGSLVKTTVSTAASDPTQSRFFKAGVAGCENCATFHGDYINVAYGSDGKANMAWTDMRDPSDVSGLFSQFIYYAQK